MKRLASALWRTSWTIARQGGGKLAIALLIVLVPVAALTVLGFAAIANLLDGGMMGLLFLTSLCQFALAPLVLGTGVSAAFRILSGGNVSGAFADGLRRYFPMLVVVIVLSADDFIQIIAPAVVAMTFQSSGIIGSTAYDLVLLAVSSTLSAVLLALWCAAPAAVARGSGPIASLRLSQAATRGHRRALFVFLLGLMLVLGTIGYGANLGGLVLNSAVAERFGVMEGQIARAPSSMLSYFVALWIMSIVYVSADHVLTGGLGAQAEVFD